MDVRDIATKLIRDSGLTQVSIAARMGMSDKQLSNRLTGATPFRADEMPALAAALGVSCADFFPGCKEPSTRALAGTSGLLRDRPFGTTPLDDATYQDIHSVSDVLGIGGHDALVEMADVLARYRLRILEEKQASGE